MFAGMDILIDVKHRLLTKTTQQIFFGSMLYLMRHGAIASTAEKRFVGKIDPPLSPDGRKQAERQGRQLMDIPFIRRIAVLSPVNTLIVTHASVIRELLCEVLQMPLTNLLRIHLDYGGLTIIQNINGKSRVKAVNLCPALLTT
jgi:broad specificity phosphatase PhoE